MTDRNPELDDLLKDVDQLLEEKEKPIAAPTAKEINWDDYNFNFDDETAPVAPPTYQPRTSEQTEQFSIEYMKKLHENAGNPQRASVSPVVPAPSYVPRAGNVRVPQEKAARPPQHAVHPVAVAPPPILPEEEAEQTDMAYQPKPRKKHRVLKAILRIFAILLALLLLFTAVMVIFGQPPKTDQPIGTRKDGCATVLLAGTDESGTRTDTLMLLYINRPAKTIRLLSIPRDTMVNRDNPVPKINGAYYANGGDEKGMGFLMDYVKDVTGYRPDGYMLIDLNCFIDLVNLMGGVKFDVPMDMYYDDPTQDLHIDLKAGEQKLNGKQAMWLVRYRSGYAAADLQRVSVQRDFMKSALSQWTKPWKLYKAPIALYLVMKNTMTDLSAFNLSWLATSVVLCGTDSLESDTLPGSGQTVNGGSYYIEDVSAATELVNARYNPYEREISADELHPYGR